MRRNGIATVVFLLLIVSFIWWYPTQYALPPSTSFTIKRIQETIHGLTLQTPVEKADYAARLLDIRLSEIVRLLEEKEFERVISAASKYSAQAHDLVAIVQTYQLIDRNDEIREQFALHGNTLHTVMPHIQEYEPTWQSLLQAADTLVAYESKLPQ